MLFDAAARPVASEAVELRQFYPDNGWVEHDAEEIWQATLLCLPRGDARRVGGRHRGHRHHQSARDKRVVGPPHGCCAASRDCLAGPAHRRKRCRALKAHEEKVAARTGLLLDPYFSATKAEWLLDHAPGARARAERGELAFGTIDSWLIYKLTGGRVHATDVTNASRTMLLDLKTLAWDDDMLRLFNVPRTILPEVRDSAGDFGETREEFFGAPIRIAGVAGDQQAALFGQACFKPGDVKSTYGTGCFALVNTGAGVPSSRNRLIATSAYRAKGETAYAIEGSIFIAGAVVQWLRDALGVIRNASEIEALARTAKSADGLYFVPAFTGLGAPYWDPDARGAITGLTRDAGVAEIARAALDAICYQTRDLLDAMARDMRDAGLGAPSAMKVDGGMVRNDWFCQRLADLTGLPVERPLGHGNHGAGRGLSRGARRRIVRKSG